MKCASTSRLVSVSSKVSANKYTPQKNVTKTEAARKKALVKRDILNTVSDTLLEIIGSKWIVPTSTKATLQSKIIVIIKKRSSS